MKNPRVIEVVIEQLIQWAAAALETSSNQPVLPHAIIVLNVSENATDPELWDVLQVHRCVDGVCPAGSASESHLEEIC